MKKVLFIIMLSLFMMTSLAWAQAYLLNEGFENFTDSGNDSRPLGWYHPDNVEQQTNDNYIRTGTGALRLKHESASIITPLLNDPGLLSFWYIGHSNASTWTLKIEYAHDKDSSTWKPIYDIVYNNTGDLYSYQESTRDLSAYSNIYIKLTFNHTAGQNFNLNIDDFTVTSRSVETIAAWDFNTNPPASGENWPSSISATAGDGTLTYDVSNPSSDTGTHLNDLDGVSPAPDADLGGSFVVKGNGNNDKYIDLEFSSIGYTNVTLSYALKRDATGFNKHKIRFSDDNGGNWYHNNNWAGKPGWEDDNSGLIYNILKGGGFVIHDHNFPTGPKMTDIPSLTFRIWLSGASNTDGSNVFDNIRITGTQDCTYKTGVPVPLNGGPTVTMTKGMANDSTADMPDIPNTSIGDSYTGVKLDLLREGPWTVKIESSLEWCAYNWQGVWYDVPANVDGTFTIEVFPADGNLRDLFIVMSSDNPTLPVELSSFMVTQESGGSPIITWETQTETGVNGFYIYRGVNKNIGEATLISSLIEATNSSLAHSYSYEDTDLIEDGTYYYWLNVSDLNGHQSYYGPAELNFIYMEEEAAPEVTYKTALRSIYPNPFNPSTNIGFELAEDSEVKIDVYNARGQLVRSFAPFTHGVGYGSIVWDGKDEVGSSVSSGIYLFRMAVGAKSYSAKALMIK